MLVSDLKIKPTYIIHFNWSLMSAYIEKGVYKEYLKLRWINYFDVAVSNDSDDMDVILIRDANERRVFEAISNYVEGI